MRSYDIINVLSRGKCGAENVARYLQKRGKMKW